MISSDGGAVLLREVDRRINLRPRLADCFEDHRDPKFIEHQVGELLAQRVYALALGYEELNAHDQPLAGKSTLHRLERTTDGTDRYKKIRCDPAAVDRLLADIFVEAHSEAPQQSILDIDATDTPLHGQQEGRFFHGYYGHYCYLPLYIFSGQHVLCARQRVASQDAAAGSVEELKRIVSQIRKAWPEGKIVLRADAGFCREELLSWCAQQQWLDYLGGLARNPRLRKMIEDEMAQAAEQQQQTGEPARVFAELA